jgi:hypothetical protein
LATLSQALRQKGFSEGATSQVSEAWHKTEAEVLETMIVLARLVQ